MTTRAEGFLAAWHRAVAERDVAALGELLADDVSLGAPPYARRFEGKELVLPLLGFVLETVDGFQYRREWRAGRELALEFTGRVGDTELQAIDLISLDGGGRVARLDVLMRPAGAIEALRGAIAPRMTELLARRAG